MRWKNLRKSSHVERRQGGRKAALGGGVGTIVIALIAMFVFKVDPSQFLSQLGSGPTSHVQGGAGSEEIDEFVDRIKGSTEEIWTKLFRQAGRSYRIPKLVNYDGRTSTGSRMIADSRMGPFYLPTDETIYLDTHFFQEMEKNLGGGGDFAYAYVIAHEVGHHVQKLLGNTDRVHSQKGRIPEAEYNRLSVRLELQADFLAGVWAHHANKKHRADFGSNLLEEGDIEEAMNSAQAIGDDALQRKAGGRIRPETFSHGTSEQRMRWFTRGLRSGDLDQGDTFALPYHEL